MPPEFQQPEYVHILINHLPIIGLGTAALALGIGILFRNRAGAMTGGFLVMLTALSYWPVSESGEDGYDRVYAMSGADAQQWLDLHASRAGRYAWLFYLTAAVSAAGVVAGWKQWSRAIWLDVAVLLLAMVTVAVSSWIAFAGGKVRHSEFREGPPAVMPAVEHEGH